MPSVPEQIRNIFIKDKTLIEGLDLGAGKSNQPKSVRHFAQKSVGKRKQLEILHRIVKFQDPEQVLELGTCLGVSTAYLREGFTGPIVTIEGNEDLFRRATTATEEVGYSSIDFLNGPFEKLLPEVLGYIKFPWFIYLDGDHSETGTLKYFDMIVSKASQNCILVIDDIYWSAGMTRAWKKICADERVPISLDFFHFGVLIFRYNQPKQHFFLKSGRI